MTPDLWSADTGKLASLDFVHISDGVLRAWQPSGMQAFNTGIGDIIAFG